MQTIEPRQILFSLAQGVDPVTMAPLPEDSPLQRPYLIRAFYAAASALEESTRRLKRKSNLPANTGKPWSKEEDLQLSDSFDSGTSIKMLAAEHQRSCQAIRSRLIRLGKASDFDEFEG
jgi:hypothetical protein